MCAGSNALCAGAFMSGLALSGCSLHPLQDDVTHLPLSDIIRKIACEAKDALDDLLDERGMSQQRHEYLNAKARLRKRNCPA